jgi:Uncharacterised nucleotidyltransferase
VSARGGTAGRTEGRRWRPAHPLAPWLRLNFGLPWGRINDPNKSAANEWGPMDDLAAQGGTGRGARERTSPMLATRDEVELLTRMARRRADPSDPRVLSLVRESGIDWERFYRLAATERVAPLVLHNLLRSPGSRAMIPEEVLTQFERSRRWTAAVKAARSAKTAEIARWFEGYSIRLMLLKGAALDHVVYEEPWSIYPGDVDLLAAGNPGDVPRDGLDRLMGQAPGFELEFVRHHDIEMTGIIDLDYDRIWSDARPLTLHGSRVWVMSPEDLLVTASIGLCRKRFLTLKDLCAVAEILDAYRDLDWPKLARDARRVAADRIVAAALLVVRSILGCEVPGAALAVLPTGPVLRGAITVSRPFLLSMTVGPMPAQRAQLAGLGLKLLSFYPHHSWRSLALMLGRFKRKIIPPRSCG